MILPRTPPTSMPESCTTTRDEDRCGTWVECRMPHDGHEVGLRTFVPDELAPDVEALWIVGEALYEQVQFDIAKPSTSPSTSHCT